MRAPKGKIIYWLLLFLFFVVAGLQLIVPPYISSNIEQDIVDYLEDSQNVSVRASAFPAWKFFYSRADSIELEADMIEYDGLILEEIYAEYGDVSLENEVIRGENINLHVRVHENSLNEYIEEYYPILNDVHISLLPDQVYVRGDINIFDSEIEIQLKGTFFIRESDRVVFVPEDIQVEELPIPPQIVENLFTNRELEFALELEELNFPLQIEETEITSDNIYLLGGKFNRGEN